MPSADIVSMFNERQTYHMKSTPKLPHFEKNWMHFARDVENVDRFGCGKIGDVNRNHIENLECRNKM